MGYIGKKPTPVPLTSSDITNDIITEAKIADDAVENEHLNANVITGHTALTSAPADTDEFLLSDAGTLKRIDYSLIKGGGGLVHLQTQNVTSGVSSVIFSTNIDSTYDSYKLIISDMQIASDTQHILLQVGTGSADNQFNADDYNRAALGRASDGTTVQTSGNGGGNAGVFLTARSMGNASDESFAAEIYIVKPSSTDTHKVIYGQSGFLDNSGNFVTTQFVGGVVGNANDVAAKTSFRIKANSGNIDRGNFSLFGVVNS